MLIKMLIWTTLINIHFLVLFWSVWLILLTEGDLGLHGHGQRRVLDFAAEQSLTVELWVQVPSENQLYLWGAVTELGLHVVAVVERAGAGDPTWKLPAYDSFGDDLGGRTHADLTQSEAVLVTGSVHLHWLNVRLQVRLLQLSIVELPGDQRSAEFGWTKTSAFHRLWWLGWGKHFD